MRLVSDDEDDVGRDLALGLVALLLERHLRARLPARLHRDAHVLVLLLRRSVRLQDAPRDFHLLHAASVDLLERHVQVVLNRRILDLFLLQRRVHVERVRPESGVEVSQKPHEQRIELT